MGGSITSRKEYPDYHELLERALGIKKRKLRLAEECDSGMSLIAAIESGRGVSISSASLACTAGTRLEYVPLVPAPSPAVVVGLAYRKEKMSPAVRSYIETIRGVAVSDPAAAVTKKGISRK